MEREGAKKKEEVHELLPSVTVKKKYGPVAFGIFLGIASTLFILNPDHYDDLFSRFSYAVVVGMWFGFMGSLLAFSILDPVWEFSKRMIKRIAKKPGQPAS